MSPETRPAHGPSASRPFQFTLRTTFIVMTAAALTMSATMAAPAFLAGLCLVAWFVILPVILTVVVIYGRGYQRTFCIGALFPATSCLLGTGAFVALMWVFPEDASSVLTDLRDKHLYRIAMVLMATLLAAVVAGLLAIWVRRLVERPER